NTPITPMKRLALLSVLLLPVTLLAGPEYIIKQRAKEQVQQSNVRQGVPPPSQPQQPPGAQNQATPPPPPPQSILTLQSDLAAITANSTVTAAQKQKLANDIMAVANGTKPAATNAAKLADDLATACSEKPLSSSSRNRLVQELDAI